MPTEATRDSLISDLLGAWRINEQINQYLIDRLSEEAWTAKPPGGKGRTIAAIVAHMHNVRLMWVKAAAKGAKMPDKLERAELSRDEAKLGLAQSAAAIEKILAEDLPMGRVSGFPPSAAAFIGYMLAHDAHHRGQITMLARQVGHPLPAQAGFGMWEWNTRAKEASQGS
jgi:uncharacterized damage-inducible protein DinB